MKNNKKYCEFINKKGKCPRHRDGRCLRFVRREVNELCEIIPRKRTKTVKAWGWFDDGFIHASADKEWCKGLGYFPVTVTYEIKEKKK